MPRFNGNKSDGSTRVQSSDYQYLSSTLHQVDDWRPNPLGEAHTPLSVYDPASLSQKRSQVQGRRFDGNKGTESTYEPFSDRVLFTQEQTLVPYRGFDLGLVASRLTLDFGIYNAFKSTETVEVLSVTADQGISINSPTAPFPIGGLEELVMVIQIESEGNALIDADISVKLVGNPILYTFNIQGVRFNLPYLLDAEWGQGVEVTRRYLTSVFTASETSEARRGLRDNPIRDLNAEVFFAGDTAAAQAQISLRRGSKGSFAVPYYVDLRRTTLDSTTTKIFCNPEYTHLQAGNYATIAEKANNTVKEFTVFRIGSVEVDGLVPDTPIAYEFPAGSEVAPAMICKASLSGSSMNAFTDQVGTFNLESEEQYGPNQLVLEDSSYTPTLFKDSAVFPFVSNRTSQYNVSIARAGSSEVSGKGTKQYLLGEREYTTLGFTSPVYGREDIWDAIGFFNYIAGRGRNFWIKEELDIFPVENVLGGGGAAYNITMREDSVLVGDYAGIEALLLIDADGTEGYALIDSVVEISGKTTIVTEVTSFSGAVRFYPLMLARMSSDEITERWITDSLMEVDFTVRELIGAY